MSNNQSNQRINLNHLAVFVEIANTKSITAAAKVLGHDKTRVSRILSQLEQDLGTKLVYRTTRDLQLTTSGELFFRHCKQVIAALENAMASVVEKEGVISGHIRMTAAHGVASRLLPEIVSDFRKIHPGVTFEFIFTQENINLVKERIDIALRIGEMPDSSMLAKVVGRVHFSFVATPAFLSRHPGLKSLDDLAGLPLFGLSKFSGKPVAVKNGEGKKSISFQFQVLCNGPDFALELVLKDDGIGLIPTLMCHDYFASGKLVEVLGARISETVPISLVFHRLNTRKPPLSTFRSFLIERLEERLTE